MADILSNSEAMAANTIKTVLALLPNKVSYDWFANVQTRVQANPVRNIVLVQGFGAGTYICTHAGSGRNSRCFKRVD
jgi:hypothetical protein